MTEKQSEANAKNAPPETPAQPSQESPLRPGMLNWVRRNRFLFACCIIAALLFSFICAEIAARRFLHNAWTFMQQDPLLGWSFRPNAKSFAIVPAKPWRLCRIPMDINSDGLRDREISHTKPKNTFRILAIGDSFIEAAQMSVENCLAKRLEAMLAEVAPKNMRFEVINAGFGNYGTAQEYLFYIERGRIYKADLVLLYFWPGNDFRDNSIELDDQAYFPKPYFSFENGNLAQMEKLEMPPAATRAQTPNRLVAILRNSAFYSLANQYMAIHMPAGFTALKWAGIFQGGKANPDREYASPFAIHKNPLHPAWQNAIDLTEELLAKMKQAVERDGAKFVPIQIPYSETIAKMYPEKTRVKWPFLFDPEKNMEIGQPERITREVFERIGSPIFDPKEDYLQEIKKNGKNAHAPDNHLNAHGHDILARATFKYLRDSGLLPGIAP